uniref:Uncharacterized protein n=1 Tax=Rhizophagus irregularis (strain DAOM 181602 / DAOM 197198 / MUCL 43194) TaxID=747089 RepID=U9T6W2_RHIID
MHDENGFREFLKRVDARGLKHIDDNNEVPKVISTFEGIQPNQLYCISAAYLMAIKKGVTWSKVEDMVVEIETTSALKNKLKKTFKSPVEVFSRIMHDETEEKINEIVERLKEFPEKLKKAKDPEFKQLSDKELVGVACGSLFPEELKRKSVELGLVVVYPDGGRYSVGMPKKWMMSLSSISKLARYIDQFAKYIQYLLRYTMNSVRRILYFCRKNRVPVRILKKVPSINGSVVSLTIVQEYQPVYRCVSVKCCMTNKNQSKALRLRDPQTNIK